MRTMNTNNYDSSRAYRPLTIGVDLDGSTFDYEDGLRNKLGQQLGINPAHFERAFPVCTGSEYAMWANNWEGIGTKEDYFKRHSLAVEDGLFEDLAPYDNAAKVLWRFHEQGHFIRIITARFLKPGDRAIVQATTSHCLDKNFIPVDDVMYTERKIDVFADVYIDDSPTNIKNLRAAGRTVIIYDQPYNREFDGLRAHNWLEVEELVNQISIQKIRPV